MHAALEKDRLAMNKHQLSVAELATLRALAKSQQAAASTASSSTTTPAPPRPTHPAAYAHPLMTAAQVRLLSAHSLCVAQSTPRAAHDAWKPHPLNRWTDGIMDFACPVARGARWPC